VALALAPPEQESGRVAIFSPHPVLTITIEARGGGQDDIHLHPGGQGVWVAKIAGELGAEPVLCGLIGGESGVVLEPLLARLPGERRLIRTEAASGCHVFDRRGGERVLISRVAAEAPSRHRLDDLFSLTCAEGLESAALVICNPDPPDAWPLEVYGNLAADVGANGTPVLVDLSSPRLDSALEGRPYLVKVNDWELAEFIRGPVDGPDRLLAAAEQVRERGAANVIITRGGEPALVLSGHEPAWLVPPRFDRGAREGCGDTMMGALAAGIARGRPWEETLITAAAAGAVNFLRHGLGSGARPVIDEVAEKVKLRPLA
jgi:1-phosphofructokinase